MSFSGGSPRFGRLGLIAAALAIVGLGAWVALHWRNAPDRSEAVARLAVAPFSNLTGEARWDWVARALPVAIVRQTQGLKGVRAFSADNANQAVAAGATHILEGYFTAESGAPEIRYSLTTAAPVKTLVRDVASAPGEELLPQAIAISEAVRNALRPAERLLPLDAGTEIAFRSLGEAFIAPTLDERERKLREAFDQNPSCSWCLEELAAFTARFRGREAVLPLLERRSQDPVSELASKRLELLAATLNNDAAKRRNALERLAVLVPADPEVLVPLAEVLVNDHRFAEAVEIYERAHRSQPERGELLNSMGYALAWAGRYDDALAALARYEQAEPESPNPADSRGEVLMMAGRFKAAEEAFLASYERDPRFNGGAALEKAALVRWLAGDAQAAGAHLERFLKHRAEERDALAPLRRARWQYLFGQTPEAVANLKLLAARPGEPAASLAASTLSLYALYAGRTGEATQYAALARQMARDSLSLFAANAAVNLASDQPAPASPDPATQAFWDALRLTFRHDLAAAEPRWREALKSAPPANAALAREMLAQVLVARGESGQAAEITKQGWPLLSADQALLFDFLVYPNLLCVRGAAAAEANQAEEARRLYEQFLHFTGSRPDPLGLTERARAATRL